MIGSGIGFILHEGGWGCSNEVFFDIEKDMIIAEGKKYSKRTEKLKFNCIFDGVGEIKQNLTVYCIYKDGEKGEEQAFAGTVTLVNNSNVQVTIQVKSDKLTEIKEKIKSWQHKLTY